MRLGVPLQLTVTAKGQLTLRRAVLDHLDIRPGQKVQVSLLPEGRIELRAADSASSIARLRGALRRPGQRRVSLAEMKEAIERGANE
jgi:bifunctional DNA-binding transcriptional regulator/antitoxin component of YhaV-PrlF toxin-antitoxin module